ELPVIPSAVEEPRGVLWCVARKSTGCFDFAQHDELEYRSQMNPMNPLVELHGVSKSYGSAIALHATALDFERGKTTVLIGPSGCGKSTLLRLIIRLLDPDAGAIRFDGVPITAANISELRR